MGNKRSPGVQAFPLFCREMAQTRVELRGKPLSELTEACDPLWTALSATEKALYKARAQEMNNPGRGAQGGRGSGLGRSLVTGSERLELSQAGKFDCMGRSLVAMRQAQMLEKCNVHRCRFQKNGKFDGIAENSIRSLVDEIDLPDREECATKDIQLRLRGDLGKSSRFILLHTVAWMEREGETIPCEMGMVELSLEKGVLRYYNQLIDANPIPIGLKGAMKEYSDKYHHIWLDNPDLSDDFQAILRRFSEMLAVRAGEKYANKEVRLQAPSEIQDLVLEQDRWKTEKKFKHLPIFVAKDNLVQSREALEWLQKQAKTNLHFECYDLSVLFYHLMNFEVDASALRIPSLSIAKALLERDVLLYTSGMSCRFHEAEENSFCAGAICSRRAFIFLDMACQALGVPKQMSRHYPLGLPDSKKLKANAKLAGLNKLANLTFEKLSLREGNIESHFLADFLDLEDFGDLTLSSELDLDSTTTVSELEHSFTSQTTRSMISRFSHRHRGTSRSVVEDSSVEDFHSAVENMSVMSRDETGSRS